MSFTVRKPSNLACPYSADIEVECYTLCDSTTENNNAGVLLEMDACVPFTANLPHTSKHNKKVFKKTDRKLDHGNFFGTLISDSFAEKVAELIAKYYCYNAQVKCSINISGKILGPLISASTAKKEAEFNAKYYFYDAHASTYVKSDREKNAGILIRDSTVDKVAELIAKYYSYSYSYNVTQYSQIVKPDSERITVEYMRLVRLGLSVRQGTDSWHSLWMRYKCQRELDRANASSSSRPIKTV